jgi:hypothetical protein
MNGQRPRGTGLFPQASYLAHFGKIIENALLPNLGLLADHLDIMSDPLAFALPDFSIH